MALSDPILIPAVGSTLANPTEYNQNLTDIETSLLKISCGSIISGGGVSVVAGLTVEVEESEYLIGIYLPKLATQVLLTDNATNRIFAVTDPDDADRVGYVVRTDATVPVNSAAVRQIVTLAGAVTSNIEHPDAMPFKCLGELARDEGMVLVSAADTTLGYLSDKLAEGLNIDLTIASPAGNEDSKIAVLPDDKTLDTYVATVAVGSDLLLTWDFTAKGAFPNGGYEVYLVVDQAPPDTLVFVLATKTANTFHVVIQNSNSPGAGLYGTNTAIRITAYLRGFGWVAAVGGADVITPTAIDYGATQAHVLATTAGLGAEHTVSGLTDRMLLIATGATTARWEQVAVTAAAADKIPIAGADGRLDRLWAPGDRTGHSVPDITTVMYKIAGNNSCAAMANQTYAINTLFALPVLDMHGATIDKIAFFVNALGAAGSVARIGLYTSISEANPYPDALLYESGAEATDAGATAIREFTANQALTPNRLHWLVYLAGVVAPTIRGIPLSAGFPIFGTSNSFGTPRYSLQTAFAYAALPASFPAGATPQNNANAPALAYTITA